MMGGVTRRMLPHLSGVPHLHVNRPLFCFCFYIYIFYQFSCRKDQYTAPILKFVIEDFIDPGCTQTDPADHHWFVFVALPSQLFLIRGLLILRKKIMGWWQRTRGKEWGGRYFLH